MTADLRPAATALVTLIGGVRDDQLDQVTPCGAITVAELLDHVDSLSGAFTAAATKTPRADRGQAPVPDASRLGQDWRERLPAGLDALAAAWQRESAWAGTTEAGGTAMPAAVAGAAVFNEVIVHGWDLAAATGQPYPGTAVAEPMAIAYAWVEQVVAQQPDGSPGLFGPPVPVPGDAPVLHRLLGLTGRDPGWRSSSVD